MVVVGLGQVQLGEAGAVVFFDTALRDPQPPGDAGKMLGRQGRTVAALRTLAATAGEREGKTVTLEIRNTPYKG